MPFLDSTGFQIDGFQADAFQIFDNGIGNDVGWYRFLQDHYVDGAIIKAGEIRQMFAPWSPTADVEPLSPAATWYFYQHGPKPQGLIRTQWQGEAVAAPVTYWVEIAPNIWALTGLGSDRTVYPAIEAWV